MGFLRVAIWTCICVGLGIFVASYDLGGKTPLQHAQKLWSGQLKSEVGDAMDDAKDKIADVKSSAKEKLALASAPKERISSDDRNALNALIAKKTEKK